MVFGLGKPKKSEDEVLANAVQKGIAEAKDAAAEAEKAHKKDELKKAHGASLAAVKAGAVKTKAKEAAEKELKKGKLQKSYNAAAGMLKGLSSLHDLPGSKFEFEVSEQKESLQIKTNIPAVTNPNALKRGIGTDKVIVSVHPNGRIRVDGDTGYYNHQLGVSYSTQQVSSKRPEKALAYVAKKATEKGLIP